MIRREDVYRIGKLGKAHGVKGELSMMIDDDTFDRVEAEYLILEMDGIMVPFFMEEYRFKTDDTVLVKFEDVDTQERAKQLTGTEVFFPRALAQEDETGELSYAQLVGFTIINAADKSEAGVIVSVDEQTVNIMFELTDGRLIPAAEELIDGIDIEKKEITMIIPEGILDL